MSREVGMLFSAPMVRGLLRAARGEPYGKFCTRRLVKLPRWSTDDWADVDLYGDGSLETICQSTGCLSEIKPRAHPGDWLYCRETTSTVLDDSRTDTGRTLYRADGDIPGQVWRPSLHMPKSAARLWMCCTGVRAERLQDITEDEARREGCVGIISAPHAAWSMTGEVVWSPSARDAFALYIDHINGGGTWAGNPWVFVYSWERVELR